MKRDYYIDDLTMYKSFKKKKELSLFKAFISVNVNDELDVSTSGELMAITPEDAIKLALSQIDFMPYLDKDKAIQDELIVVVEFVLDREALEEIPILRDSVSPPIERNNAFEIELLNKKWEMKLHKYKIQDIVVDLNDQGNITKFTELKLNVEG